MAIQQKRNRMKVPFLDLQAQYSTIKDEIKDAMNEVIETTDFIQGKEVRLFEKKFSELLNIDHCIAVGNGTDALVVALKSLGIGAGDEVIVPANSFISTAEAVTVVGAKVVFIDVDIEDFNMNPSLLEYKVTHRTKAIIAVHLFGRMSKMLGILRLANEYGLKIIEDCAQAHLSTIITKSGEHIMAGTMGHIATFSFYPGKNLGAYGDAGAVVTRDKGLAENARRYSNHGRIAKYDHDREGINSRMDSLQACVLNIKINHISEWTQRRREIALKYNSLLSGLNGIYTPQISPHYNSSWHLYVIRCEKRDLLKTFLEENGVSVGIHYPIALPFLGAYSYLNCSEQDFPVAYSLQSEILSLPIYPELDDEMIVYVCQLIEKFSYQ